MSDTARFGRGAIGCLFWLLVAVGALGGIVTILKAK